MNRIRQTLFAIHYPYTNPIDRQRAQGLRALSLIVLLVWALWLLAVVIPTLSTGGTLDTVSLALVGLIPLLSAGIYYFVQSGYVGRASWVLVGLLLIAAFPVGGLQTENVVLAMLALIGSGVVLKRTGVAMVTAVLAALLAITELAQPPAQQSPPTLVFVLLSLAVGAAFLMVFGGNARQLIRQSHLEVEQLETVTRFTTHLKGLDTEQTALVAAIQMVTDKLGYSFAQIYWVDEAGSLTQRIRAGLGMAREAVTGTVSLTSASAVNEALRTREPVAVNRQGNPNRHEHFLTTTRTALEIPLLHDRGVLGVLDVQSRDEAGFTPAQVEMLTLIANQLVAALHRIQRVEGLRRSGQEQAEIADHLRRQLMALRRGAQAEVGSAWEEYLQRRGVDAVGFDLLEGDQFRPATDLPDELRAALERGEVVIEANGDDRLVSVPIRLRGETVGAMSFTVPGDQPLTERQKEMALGVADRLAQSLETKRLVEQTQEQAFRERKANETASLLLSSTDVNTVVQLAAESFNQALGAINTRIYLNPAEIAESSPTTTSEDTQV